MVKSNKPKLIGEQTIFIDKNVVFGENVTIYPGNIIYGKCIIESGCTLLPQNYIVDSVIGKGATVDHSHIEQSVIGNHTKIGPYSRLRPNTKVGDNCKVGNFVEIKNSTLGNGTKASHLAYIGDADIGENCNIGCGVIFANYNGKEKFRTTVGNNCFIGSNSNIIAPINISNGSYICAGTTITKDTSEFDFVIGRMENTVKKDYAKKYLKKTK